MSLSPGITALPYDSAALGGSDVFQTTLESRTNSFSDEAVLLVDDTAAPSSPSLSPSQLAGRTIFVCGVRIAAPSDYLEDFFSVAGALIRLIERY